MPEPVERRSAHFAGEDGPVDTPVYRRDDLPAGAAFDGPAVVEQLDSTVLVPPGVRAEVDAYRNIRMTIEAARP
jgi:N-methylhydantoinase A